MQAAYTALLTGNSMDQAARRKPLNKQKFMQVKPTSIEQEVALAAAKEEWVVQRRRAVSSQLCVATLPAILTALQANIISRRMAS